MEPQRTYLHANFRMPPMDQTVRRQLRNLPSRHIATPVQLIQQSAHGRRYHNIAPARLASDLDDSSDDDLPLVAFRNQKTHQ